MTGGPQTINEYLAGVRADQRAALRRLRSAIRAAAPSAEECMSYQLPAFRLAGRMLVWFGAATNHCAFYPGSSAIEAHRDELSDYPVSKGTVRFQPGNPLPATLVRKLVKARIAALAARKPHGPAAAARRRRSRTSAASAEGR
jgi:uncharacterized protein YdhG (YjbR/CyaY superfamily)